MEVQLVSSFRDDVIHSLVCKKKKKKLKFSQSRVWCPSDLLFCSKPAPPKLFLLS